MTREEIIDGLKAVRTIHNGNYAPHIDEAIASLKAWDKVKEELEKECVEAEYMPFRVKVYQLGISKALDIIEKYKKEIEE